MPSYAEFLAAALAAIREVLPAEALAGAPVVIDVREADERAEGTIPGARAIPRGSLESRIEAEVPDRATAVVVYCAAGHRSALAARTLGELGYGDVRSLAGGFSAWRAAGLPVARADADDLTPAQRARYARHLILPEVGEAGQRALLAARVAVIGAGGLGSPVALYLAAAGVGTLTIIDDDLVDASNLQRQVLHTTERVGQPKVDSAARTIAALNPDVTVRGHQVRLSSANALELLADHQVIVDGTDNFATRYLVNDAALRLGVPVVHASIWRFEGQLTVFGAGGQPCYRCLYPAPPPPGAAPSCAEAGVLGVLPGVLGVLQATEAIKLVLGLPTVAGRLLVYDALRAKLRDLALRRDPACATCGDGVDRTTIPLIDYAAFCAGP
ncbi:MAG: molybdopterin-synthase adenylyltransferase MoeB [Myxococcales bacterium]|nr:molybdopterin-synthase adenylyltransferase MoeB [Myxococcales bacterium]